MFYNLGVYYIVTCCMRWQRLSSPGWERCGFARETINSVLLIVIVIIIIMIVIVIIIVVITIMIIINMMMMIIIIIITIIIIMGLVRSAGELLHTPRRILLFSFFLFLVHFIIISFT